MVGFFKKIKENSLREYSLTITTVYLITYFIYRDFNISLVYGFSIISIGLILMSVNVFYEKKLLISNTKLLFIIFTTIVFSFFLLPNSNKDKQNFAFIIVMILMAGNLILSKINLRDMKISAKIIQIFSIIVSIYILFFQIFKSFYWSSVYLILSPSAKSYAEKYFFNGYSVSIGGITYTLYIITISFFITLTKLMYCDSEPKKQNIILLFLLFFIIVLSGRRGELLAVILTGIIYRLLSTELRHRKKMIIKIMTISFLFLLLTIIFLPTLSKIPFLYRYTITLEALFYGENLSGGITSGRINLYSLSWNQFKKHPLFGIGFGKFRALTESLGISNHGRGMDVHNIGLQLLAENGIFGFVFYLIIPIYICYNTIQDRLKILNLKKDTKYSLISVINGVSLLLQTFILIVSLIDPINYKIKFWILYFICFYLYSFSNNVVNENETTYDLFSLSIKYIK